MPHLLGIGEGQSLAIFITIDLEFDGDQYPIIRIETGGNFTSEKNRPAVDLYVNGIQVHDMFAEDDFRWVLSEAEMNAAADAIGYKTVEPQLVIDAIEAHKQFASSLLQTELDRCIKVMAGGGGDLTDRINSLCMALAVRKVKK